jgi:hypothetical protein
VGWCAIAAERRDDAADDAQQRLIQAGSGQVLHAAPAVGAKSNALVAVRGLLLRWLLRCCLQGWKRARNL